ncbi:MAG: PDZ domain-containing protein [Bacteroidia bacterium]
MNTWRVFILREKSGGFVSCFANAPNAGGSYLTPDQIYFNPFTLFMYVPGRLNGSVSLSIPNMPDEWIFATQMKKIPGEKRFEAPTYHYFIDSPFVTSRQMIKRSFHLQNADFHIYFQGDFKGDDAVVDAAVDISRKICDEAGAIYGRFPFSEYHFIYRLLPYQFRHGVEHTNSVSMAVSASLTESTRSINGIAGLAAHEIWHAWNVKRIRPAALWPYDYSQPQYTHLHWFTEGVTSYYANLLLVRAGLISEEQFFQKTAANIEDYENSYAASVITASEASFDSWLETSSNQNPQLKVSYYALGQRLGLLFDLALREKSDGAVTLDGLFNFLMFEYYDKNQGVPENGIQLAAETLTRSSWQDFFDKYVNGTEPINYDDYFSPFGLELKVQKDARPGARGMGILGFEKHPQGIITGKVHPGGDAYLAGLSEGDFILEINGKNATEVDLDDFVSNLKKGTVVNLKVYTDFQLKEIDVPYEGRFVTQKYTLEKKGRLKDKEMNRLSDWLGSKAKE